MRRPLIAALALVCSACQTPLESGSLDRNRHRPTAKQLRWFAIASFIRQCNGRGSIHGAVLAATAASIGAVYYIGTAPRSVVSSREGRRRISALMDAAYKGRFGKPTSYRNCARVTAGVASLYGRQPEKVRKLIVRLAGTLLRADRTGQTALARVGRTRAPRRNRRTYFRHAARVRRGALKPSEQQLPIGK
jgi:hypothetical protein